MKNGTTTRLRRKPRIAAYCIIIALYESTSAPPISKVSSPEDVRCNSATRYANTSRTAIGWHGVSTHFGAIMTGRRSVK